MARRWQIVLGLTMTGMVAATPLVYSSHRTHYSRNFRVVEEGVLYRSGQLTPDGLERVVRERGIKTIVSLRTTRVKGRLAPDSWEESFCKDRNLNHVRIVPRVWGADETGDVPAEQAIREFLTVMDKHENYPVLVHCFAGIHRTGTMCAIFRMEFHRWPADRAINEMQQYGFEPADMIEDIEGYLRDYVPRWERVAK
jgi:tyrosine-protein phosphatase SIW14